MLNVAVLFFARPGYFFLPVGHGVSPSGGVSDACAACDFASPARGKGGLLGAAPLLGPLCTPPGAPPKKYFQFSSSNEGTRLMLRELPSLALLAQVISLRDALMPEDTFALNASPLQPNTTGLVARLKRALALFPRDFWVFNHHQARTNHESKQKPAPLRKMGAITASSIQP